MLIETFQKAQCVLPTIIIIEKLQFYTLYPYSESEYIISNIIINDYNFQSLYKMKILNK